MFDNILLHADEMMRERPFTHPQHSQSDAARLRLMVQQLIDTYDDPDVRPLIRADKKFEGIFHQHPGLLSLSTVR